MKRLLPLLFLLLAGPVVAQSLRSAPLFYKYDVSSGSAIYGTFLGQNGDPFGGSKSVPTQARIKTAGSSTTVTEETASTNPFTSVAAGDILIFPVAGVQTTVLVTARASAASITVDTAVDISAGTTFRYYSASRGTGATTGWLRVADDGEKTWSWTIATINATNITVSIQCIDDYTGAPAVTVYPPVTSLTDTCYTGIFTAAKTCKFVATEPYAACRFGMLVTGDAGAQSVTAGYQGRKKGN